MEQIFGVIISAIFGAIFGSYATLFAYRLPIGESCFGRYFGKKSRCPQCESIIKTRDLIPLLNWIITLGRCRNCGVKIPKTHLFIEISNTVLFVLCYLKYGFSEAFLTHCLISSGLVILLATDYTHKTFPYQILNFILAIGLVNRVLQDGEIIQMIFSGAFGIVFAAIFYQLFFKKIGSIFASQEHFFDYIKFILIASVSLQFGFFLLYFTMIIAVFLMLLIFDLPNKANRNNWGYVFIIPYFWLIL